MTDAATSGAQPGNSNAHRGALVREAFRKVIAEKGKGDFDKGLKPILLKTYKLACDGEQWAVQEIFNRLSGRVVQSVEMSGPNGGDIPIRDATSTLGIARRVAFVLAQGALAKASLTAKEATSAAHEKG